MKNKKTLLSEYKNFQVTQNFSNMRNGRNSFQSSKAGGVIKRKLSSSVLKSKSEVENLTAFKRRYNFEDPFK